MRAENWIQDELTELRGRHLARNIVVYPFTGGRFVTGDRTILNFSSNDYLNLATDERLVRAAQDASGELGTGSGAARLMTGTLPIHERLEEAVAVHKGYPAALVFGSGFLTNAGVIPAVVGRSDHVFSDRLVHASIVDGIVLSRAQHHRFRHNDCDHLRELLAGCPSPGRKLIVTESVFSMDGDVAPLSRIAALAEEYGALLMVDEAHATGVFGPIGGGLVREQGLESKVNLAMGTFSKALGSYGGFVACTESMWEWLVNRARGFIYTTALPPGVVAASLTALKIVEEEPKLGPELLRRAAFFRGELQEAGLDTGTSVSQIIPVMVGESEQAVALASKLRDKDILALPVRPPTVPAGTARLRLSLTLAHTKDDLVRAAKAIAGECRALGISSEQPKSIRIVFGGDPD